ncbi:MAG: DUF402 domain-containing protein [bacterium]
MSNRVKIHAYKHNGKLHLVSLDTYIIEETDDFIVCGNSKARILENDSVNYRTKETALLFFFKNSWFNVICQFKKHGIFYYCNIASPYIYENNIIKYIDYDLDLRIFPDGNYKVLDKNEYIYHKKLYNYSDDIDKIVKGELSKLIENVENSKFPFSTEEVLRYLEKFEKVNRS